MYFSLRLSSHHNCKSVVEPRQPFLVSRSFSNLQILQSPTGFLENCWLGSMTLLTVMLVFLDAKKTSIWRGHTANFFVVRPLRRKIYEKRFCLCSPRFQVFRNQLEFERKVKGKVRPYFMIFPSRETAILFDFFWLVTKFHWKSRD